MELPQVCVPGRRSEGTAGRDSPGDAPGHCRPCRPRGTWGRAGGLLGRSIGLPSFWTRAPRPLEGPLGYTWAFTGPPERAGGLLGRSVGLPSLSIGNANSNFYLVFGRFPAELGPDTRSNGPGSKYGAERAQNKPRRQIIRQFRSHFLA